VPDLFVYRWDRIPRDAGGDVAVRFTDLTAVLLGMMQGRARTVESSPRAFGDAWSFR
jgi:hypothetical protein